MRYAENEICYKCDHIIPTIIRCPFCRFYNKITKKERKIRMLLDWPAKPKPIPIPKKPKPTPKPKKPTLKVKTQGVRKCLACGNKYMGNARHSYCSWHCSKYTTGFARDGRKKWLEEFLGI